MSARKTAPEMWKMTQFKNVKSKLGAHHENSRARSATIRKWK